MADAVSALPNTTVLNRVNIVDFAVKDNRICGAFGIGIENDTFYVIEANAVLICLATTPCASVPVGAMVSLQRRAINRISKVVISAPARMPIAPTGTLAQGVGAKQINSHGEVYETKYGLTTSERVYGTVNENVEGRGPCYLRTEGITPEQDESLLKAYLNMAPSQTLKWIESGKNPSQQNVEIEGTEPYIVGGHTASGYVLQMVYNARW